jgi:RsiW-degrading membrane proteinase PrsW (M82 family)
VTVAVALVPVVLMLGLLRLLDSFKLVRLPTVLSAIGAGALIAASCLPVNSWLFDNSRLSIEAFTRYLAPAIEEILKAGFILLLLWRRRIGFLVDAAVLGFATGAGFALVENVHYLRELGDPSLALWLVRGLGTAVLHGTTTAVFAIVTKALLDSPRRRLAVAWLPGLALAFVLHSAFNHVPLPPLAMTTLLMLVLPLVMVVVFHYSERGTREWIGAGLDLDLELLELVRSEFFATTRFGTYLHELRARFGGMVAADMFCLLRLDLEVSIQAKAMLIAREAGLDVPPSEDLRDTLHEVECLQQTIGRTGLIALKPLQVTSDRDRWHRYVLREAARSTSR